MPDGSSAEIIDLALRTKPELVVHAGDLPATAAAVRDLLASCERFYDRDMPVRLIRPANLGPPLAVPLTRHNVVIEVHRLCQPMGTGRKGAVVPVTLPDRVAQMYLDMRGDWRLPSLAGVTTSPLLSADGTFRVVEGYDRATRLLCCDIPHLNVVERPTKADAAAAMAVLRGAFRTFPFADSPRCWDHALGIEVVDLTRLPGRDESAFLVSLLTAVCRASLWLAPGVLITAPAVSGAASGKGLLVRAICIIAFNFQPQAFTCGANRAELEKRLAANLIEAAPALFLDNVNGLALRSDTLASVLTERPARVRLLGQTRMVELNSSAFIAITGNGLTVSEDLARRFILCELDPRCEDPELRPFGGGFLDQVKQRRFELLTALLTIWRFARQNASDLPRGKPLGSFETWAEWCRDPFLALGCQDPVERIEALKVRDPQRQRVAEFFQTWWENHGAEPMKVNQLADVVKSIADPQGRGRQYLATYIAGLAGTHAAGFVLGRQEAAGKWTAATYVLSKADPTDAAHRTHRTDRAFTADGSPMTPMGPMPDDAPRDVPPGEEAAI
jgi:hypothetical protein